MRTMNVGIVGAGFIGKVHAYGYINLPLFYGDLGITPRLTHVCASRPESAEAARRAVGAQTAVTDYRAITENPDIDIVHICTPNHLHREALLSAMQHQKHIYCDKPLVATLEEAGEIESALPAYRGTAQMTLQNRFFPATIRARQLIEGGFLGQPLEYRAAYLHAGSADPAAPLKWKLSAAAGGGVIADLASHVMDLMHHLLGDFTAVCATTHIAYAERPSAGDPATMQRVEAEDCVMLLARMACGCPGFIEATKIASGVEDELRFEIHGSKGALRFNGMDAHHLEIYDATRPGSPSGGLRGWTAVDTGQRYEAPANGFPGPKFAIGWLRGHMACLANFIASIGRGEPGNPGLRQGIYIQKLIARVRESAGTNQWVEV